MVGHDKRTCKNATPKALHYSLQTTGLAIGKERKLFKALADRMNLKINSDKNSATGNYGRNHIWLTLNENEIRISMTPEGKIIPTCRIPLSSLKNSLEIKPQRRHSKEKSTTNMESSCSF